MYRAAHNTDVVLIKSKKMSSSHEQQHIFLVLFGLNAAFDTINYSILLDRMKDAIRLGGTALDWINLENCKRSFQEMFVNYQLPRALLSVYYCLLSTQYKLAEL